MQCKGYRSSRLIQFFRKNFTLLIALTLFSPFIHAENNSVTNSVESDLVALYNPLGISLSAEFSQREVYRRDSSPIYDGLYQQWGAQGNINPAFIRAGMHLELLPLAIIKFRLQYDLLYFNGTSGSLLSFTSADDYFGDSVLESREGDEQSADGERDLFSITFQFKFGQTIIRNIASSIRYRLPEGGAFYLEREYELLISPEDTIQVNQFYLLFKSGLAYSDRYFGPYHDYAKVSKTANIRERLGLTWFQEYKKPLYGIETPRWYLQAGEYIQDPNREGETFLVIGVGGRFNL